MHKYIIDFKNDASTNQITEYLRSMNANILLEYNAFEKLYLVEAPYTPLVTSIVEHVVDDEQSPLKLLTTIIPDRTVSHVVTDGSVPMIQVPNDDKNWWKYYSLAEPDLDATIYITNRRGNNSVIYVMDSGIDDTHPEFEEATIHQLFSFNGDFADKNGHGTALASVMVGKTCGMTRATVKSVKIFETGTPTKQSDLLAAFDAIFKDYSESDAEHFIVNMSWSVPKNLFIESKIRAMMAYGIFFVAAAGNSGMPISDVTPASMDEVLTIGSYNNKLEPSNFTDYTGGSEISYTGNYTNYGELDGFAPGEMIWAATPNTGYGFTAGTSIAAAIQSAALAYNFESSYLLPQNLLNMDTHSYHRVAGMGRRGLLDLSRPKYAYSNNQITTFFDKRSDYGNTTPFVQRFRVVESKKFIIQLFNPLLVESVEVLGELPHNMLINNIGKMAWTSPGISDGSKFKLHDFTFRIKYLDGSVADEVFTLVVTNEEFDPAVDASSIDDPVLQVSLLADSQCSASGGGDNCISGFCVNDCGFVGCTFNVSGSCPPSAKFNCFCQF